MKKSLFIILLLTLHTGLIGCVTHEKSLKDSNAQYYDQKDLEMLFSKKHLAEFKTGSGAKGKIAYSPDGKTHVWFDGKEDNGKYRLENGQYCSFWETMRQGEKCTKWYKISDNVFELVTTGGSYDSTVTFLE